LWKRLLSLFKRSARKSPSRKSSFRKSSSRRRKAAPRRGARRRRRSARAKGRVAAKRPLRKKLSRKKPAKKKPSKKRLFKKRLPKKRPSGKKRRPAKKVGQAQKKVPAAAEITHYFPKVRAAVLKLRRPLRLGDPIWIKGHTTDFRQTIGSLQIDRKPITTARPGQDVGLEVLREVRQGDKVFLVEGPRR